MVLGFKEIHDGMETRFVGKILICREVKPGPDYARHEDRHDKAISGNWRPKLHTLRVDKLRRWKAGRLIHFTTGVRKKKPCQFGLGTCTGVQEVTMNLDVLGLVQVTIDGRTLSIDERLEFARNDGFDTWGEFCHWFRPLIEASNQQGEDLTLRLIHWTDLRY